MTAATWDAVHDGREAFRACLRAMCEPGRPVPAPPRAGLASDPLRDAAAAVLLGLLDVGVGLCVVGDAAARELGDELLRRTGAAPAPLCDADFVLVAGAAAGAGGAAAEARRGSALRPEAGATVVYAGGWAPVVAVLEGPGLEAPAPVSLALPPGELELLAAAAAQPPAGVDAFVLSAAGLTALPRSIARSAA